MNITINRYRHKTACTEQGRSETLDGHLYIDGQKICDTAENANGALPEGEYEVTLLKCKQYKRKMLRLEAATLSNPVRSAGGYEAGVRDLAGSQYPMRQMSETGVCLQQHHYANLLPHAQTRKRSPQPSRRQHHFGHPHRPRLPQAPQTGLRCRLRPHPQEHRARQPSNSNHQK